MSGNGGQRGAGRPGPGQVAPGDGPQRFGRGRMAISDPLEHGQEIYLSGGRAVIGRSHIADLIQPPFSIRSWWALTARNTISKMSLYFDDIVNCERKCFCTERCVETLAFWASRRII